MAAKRLTGLRIMVIVILALLGLQYEFGMAVNLATQPSLAPFGFSLTAVTGALNQIGAVAVIHASLGSALVIIALINLILSLRSGLRSLQVFGSLAFLTILLAAITGLLYTLSGFQNNGDTHGMATNFLLSFTFYFLELYFMKPIRLSA
jgi:hypothetical protein